MPHLDPFSCSFTCIIDTSTQRLETKRWASFPDEDSSSGCWYVTVQRLAIFFDNLWTKKLNKSILKLVFILTFWEENMTWTVFLFPPGHQIFAYFFQDVCLKISFSRQCLIILTTISSSNTTISSSKVYM